MTLFTKRSFSLLFVLLISGALGAEEHSAVSLLTQKLAKVDQLYANFALTGERRSTQSGKDGESKGKLNFAQLGEQRLARIQHPGSDQEKSREFVAVSTPEVSFVATKVGDDPFEIGYVSPAGEKGREIVLQQMLLLALTSKACNSLVYYPLTEMIAAGQLTLKDRLLDPAKLPERLELEIVRLTIPKLLNPPAPADKNRLSHQVGVMTVLPTQGWCVERLKLKSVYQDGSFGHEIEISVRYDGLHDGVPIMQQIVWDSDAYHIEVDIQKIEFGKLKPADFTLEGCGIDRFTLPGEGD